MAEATQIQPEEPTEKDTDLMASMENMQTEINEVKTNHEEHGHLEDGTKSIQQILKQVASIEVKSYKSEGLTGLSATISVRKGDDSGACNIVVTNGIITSTTCDVV